MAATEEEITAAFQDLQFVGQAECFTNSLASLRRVARTEVPVLICGETGTGKELAARAVHYLGVRRNFPFVPVNCGALPDNLLESELFGHVRGAFTDAKQGQPGLIKLAEGGTLFLDEVDALSPKAQVSLLRFLQDGEFRPIGGHAPSKANVRVVAASNALLTELSARGCFRTDLLFRLAVVAVAIPPLRERKGDIALLTAHFVTKCADIYKQPIKRVTSSTLALLEEYDWPGNVRELQNFVHGAFVLAEGDVLTLPESSVAGPVKLATGAGPADGVLEGSLKDARMDAIERFEKRYLTRLMFRTSGNVSEAARVAGQDRRALGRLLKKHKLDRRQFAAGA